MKSFNDFIMEMPHIKYGNSAIDIEYERFTSDETEEFENFMTSLLNGTPVKSRVTKKEVTVVPEFRHEFIQKVIQNNMLWLGVAKKFGKDTEGRIKKAFTSAL